MHHSFEEKLRVVQAYKSDKRVSWICQHNGVTEKQVHDWVYLFDLYGENGLHHGHSTILSGEEKERIVRLVLEKGFVRREVYIHNHISRSALESWIRKVRSHGYSALYECKPKGRPNMAKMKKSTPKTELEKLQEENLRLRAENALLKKAKALMEELESRRNGSGQKSSNH